MLVKKFREADDLQWVPFGKEKAVAKLSDAQRDELRQKIFEISMRPDAERRTSDQLTELRRLAIEDAVREAAARPGREAAAKMLKTIECLQERYNLAANGVEFTNPKVNPNKPLRTLEKWIAMDKPLGSAKVHDIENYRRRPKGSQELSEAVAPRMAAE